MNTRELREWTIENDVENKTIDGFWNFINSFEAEEGEPFFDKDIDKANLEITLDSVALFIGTWSDTSYFKYGIDYIVSYLSVIHKEDNLGTYKMLFTLDGEVFDDSFSAF